METEPKNKKREEISSLVEIEYLVDYCRSVRDQERSSMPCGRAAYLRIINFAPKHVAGEV
jgi:hypothetical protein